MGTNHTSLSVAKHTYTDISDTSAQLIVRHGPEKYMLKQPIFTLDIKGNLPVAAGVFFFFFQIGDAQVSVIEEYVYISLCSVLSVSFVGLASC